LPRDWPIPETERAAIRTALGREMFTAQYGRAPTDARELSGLLARASRQQSTAVASYDLTFTPVKSVSALWAVAPPQVAQAIERAHFQAVELSLTWLEQNAAYTRLGRGAVRQVQTCGLIAAAFTHRDSRAGDPNLHTHVAVSNKVQVADTAAAGADAGRWLALDGRPLHNSPSPPPSGTTPGWKLCYATRSGWSSPNAPASRANEPSGRSSGSMRGCSRPGPPAG